MSPSLKLTDRRLALLIALAALLLYGATLAPGVVDLADDSLEFQYLGWPAAIPHPTGYPLYAILLTSIAHLVPLGELAWRANLLSALLASAALGLTFLVGRRLGLTRLGAAAASAFFATTPTFWAQATLAEVYTLHLLLVAALVWTLLRWAETSAPRWLVLAALVTGLGLAHHRMIVLWLPAAFLFGVLTIRKHSAALRLPWRRGLLALILPLLLYLWLPLRASVGSLDGSYEEVGFSCWITACQYQTTFLGQSNPLAGPVPPTYFLDLTMQELGLLVAGLTLLGAVWLFRDRARWLLLVGGTVTSALFALILTVPDREVFWLPTLWGLTLLAGGGVTWIQRTMGRRLAPTLAAGLLTLALVIPLTWQATTARPDRSGMTPHPVQNGEWVNGIDMLSQPLPDESLIIGLQGEAVYLKYLQATRSLASEVTALGLPTDPPALRLEAVEEALSLGQQPYLTRPLEGAGERWSLSAAGPLIEVREVPHTTMPSNFTPLGVALHDSVTLEGWQLTPVAEEEAHWLTLAWHVNAPLPVPLKVSVRRLDATGQVLAQNDAIPVHNAYPTTLWRPNEVILDSYRLPLVSSDAGGQVQVILYEAQSGREVGRVEGQP